MRFESLFASRINSTIGIPSSEYSIGGISKWTIPLNYGMPAEELFPVQKVSEAMKITMDNFDRKILQYGGGDGVSKLERWLHRRYSTSWNIDHMEDEILVTYGASQAIDLIARTFLNDGDEVWVEAPTYFGALYIFSNYNVALKEFPIDKDGVDVNAIEDELIKRVSQGKKIPKLFYTIPTFQNPTGTTLSMERRKKLSELAAKYNFVIVEDDCYGDITFLDKEIIPIKALGFERTIYISSFSKVIAPGFRIGWIIANKNIASELKKMKPDGGTSGVTQEIMANLLENIDYQEHIDLLKDYYFQKKNIMENSLTKYFTEAAQWYSPSGGFYIWVTLPEVVDTNVIICDALKKRVNFVPGSNFYIGNKERNQLRLSFAYSSASSIEVGVRRLAEVIGNKLQNDEIIKNI